MSTFTAESISANGIVAFVLGTSDGESLRLFEDGARVTDLSAITRWTATLAGVTVDSDGNAECFDWTSETETSGDLLVLKFGTLDLDLGDTALVLTFYDATYPSGKQLDSVIPASIQGTASGSVPVELVTVDDSEVELSDSPSRTLQDLFDGGYDVTIKPQDIVTKGPWVDIRAYHTSYGGASSTWQAAFVAAAAVAYAAGKPLSLEPGANYTFTTAETDLPYITILGNDASIIEGADITTPMLTFTTTQGSGEVLRIENLKGVGQEAHVTEQANPGVWNGDANDTDGFIRTEYGKVILRNITMSDFTYGIYSSDVEKFDSEVVDFSGFQEVRAWTGYNYNAAITVNGGNDISIRRTRGDNVGSVVLIGGTCTNVSVDDTLGETVQDHIVYVSSAAEATIRNTRGSAYATLDHNGNMGGGITARGGRIVISDVNTKNVAIAVNVTPLAIASPTLQSGVVINNVVVDDFASYAVKIDGNPGDTFWFDDVVLNNVTAIERTLGGASGVLVYGGDASHAAKTGFKVSNVDVTLTTNSASCRGVLFTYVDSPQVSNIHVKHTAYNAAVTQSAVEFTNSSNATLVNLTDFNSKRAVNNTNSSGLRGSIINMNSTQVALANSGTSANNILTGVTGGGSIGITDGSTTSAVCYTDKMTGAQALLAATTISPYSDNIPITCSGSVTSTATPTVYDGIDGQKVRILNVGSGTLTIQDQGTLASSNLRLTANTIAIAPRQSVELAYSATVGDWVQTGALVTVL